MTKIMEPPRKEFGSQIYNVRYKYGYNWGCYQKLALHLIQMMEKNVEKDKKVIDIGCGVGWFTDMCYFNISRDIKGIDFSKLAILFHANRMYPAIDFEIADIYEYDYTGCEVAILMEVLEHIDKDIELISRLPSGCIVYATVPFEKERMDMTHVREYSINSTMERYGELLDFKTCEKFEQYIVIRGIRK
jgi:2-polyprenyl-3-methyl-5-hydroxy-6-metoxy-1,4-benzoquinol methylase